MVISLLYARGYVALGILMPSTKRRRDRDPLDLELMERASESAGAGVKGNDALCSELDSDEGLEAGLRRELIEIALANGVNDTETLRDILIATLSES